MKKERFDYFKSFVKFASKALEAAKLTEEEIANYNLENAKIHMDKIHIIEHEADKIKHDVIEHLLHEFVSPIEREDIVGLVQQLDNVVDCMDEVTRKMVMFRIGTIRDDVALFAKLLVKSCEELQKVCEEFCEFKKSKTIKDTLININNIEAEADKLHFDAITKLFDSGITPVEIMAWKEVYDTLEECFDSCEHTADVIEMVILKNT